MEDIYYGGNWWRFSAYEIRDGYVRPAPSATLHEYAPLDEFQAARSERKEQVAVYEALLRCLDNVGVDSDGRPGAGSEAPILEWCSRHGLLGLLLHQVLEARFAPRWERRRRTAMTPEDRAALTRTVQQIGASTDPNLKRTAAWLQRPADRRPALHYTQTEYRRTNWGSFLFGDVQELTGPMRRDLRLEGRTVSDALWPRTTPSVLTQNLSTGEWEYRPVGESWGGFFPDVPPRERATYQYPKPYSEEFWRGYAEPLDMFIAAVRSFQRGFLSAARLKNPKEFTVEGEAIQPTTSALNALIPPVGSALLKMRDGSFEQRQVSPSLLGTLVIMAQQDLASDRRVIRCQNDRCRMVVVAVGYQTAYCSQQCGYAAQQRAHRARKKARAAADGGRARPAPKAVMPRRRFPSSSP